MSRRVIVREPVRLDILARDLLGTERDGMVEAMLAANPGMADDAYATEGATVIVPDVERPAARLVKTVDPWE
jgi:phage tail protein X